MQELRTLKVLNSGKQFFYFYKLTDVYSEEIFAFVFKTYYKLYKINSKIGH
jgi:hypothetical protein